MNVHTVEAKLNIQIAKMEEEETRLQDWLECLRKVESIAGEWNQQPSETQLKPAVQSEGAQEESGRANPVEESAASAEEQTQPEGEAKPVFLDRAGFEMNLQQLRQSAEQEKENQKLQEKEFEQLRKQLCASRPKSSISGRLGVLMSFLAKM